MIFPNESQEYRDARDALLRQEVELMRQLEAVTAQRQSLPPDLDVQYLAILAVYAVFVSSAGSLQ
jgi:predicted dithiol-disulfide oxidoreductase (DUF899 family)